MKGYKILYVIFCLSFILVCTACGKSEPPETKSDCTPIFEFLNTEESNRFLADIQAMPVNYLQISYSGSRFFRTAITDQAEILNVFTALKKVEVVEETQTTPVGSSYTLIFRMDNGFRYPFVFNAETLEINNKNYTLHGFEEVLALSKKIVDDALPADGSPYQPGDIVYYGVYEQDNNLANGEEKIAWQVMDVKDDKVLLLSQVCLETKTFHDSEVAVIAWENSDLRRWLNNDFFVMAFSPKEKNSIAQTTVINTQSSKNNYAPMNDTQDKIFLLSEAEIYQYFDDKMENDGSFPDRQAGYSNYIRARLEKWGPYEYNHITWWLRSPGHVPGKIMNSLLLGGGHPDIWTDGIRPAMWVLLSGINQ